MSGYLSTLLCAAYTLEQKSLDIVRAHIYAGHHHHARERLQAHFVETQWQIKLLDACLEFQKIDRALLRSDTFRPFRNIAGINLRTMKRIEIYLYKKIITAARRLQAEEVLQASREILEQERAMVEWIEDNPLHMQASLAA